jgi:hypothetical protein
MCNALDMPCGARGDFDHIEAKLYRMASPYIEFATANISTRPLQQQGAFFLFSSKKSAPVNDFFHFPIAHPGSFCYNYQKMIYIGCVLL